MIKGEGYLNNYIDLKNDLLLIGESHPSVNNNYPYLHRIHNYYRTIYSRCPIAKNLNYSSLPQKYEDIWQTLFSLYFNDRLSNFCCYCGKNEPDRLDHFHPSSKVPQYSLLRFNLVRSCVKCNEKKLAREPISILKLKHPYFDNIYTQNNILFDVVFKDVGRNVEGDVFFDIDVIPNSNLTRSQRIEIDHTLNVLEIKQRVGHRVATELENIYSIWSSFKGTPTVRKNEFKARAVIELSKKNFREYFCYKILSSVDLIKTLDKI